MIIFGQRLSIQLKELLRNIKLGFYKGDLNTSSDIFDKLHIRYSWKLSINLFFVMRFLLLQ